MGMCSAQRMKLADLLNFNFDSDLLDLLPDDIIFEYKD